MTPRNPKAQALRSGVTPSCLTANALRAFSLCAHALESRLRDFVERNENRGVPPSQRPCSPALAPLSESDWPWDSPRLNWQNALNPSQPASMARAMN